MTSTIVDTLHVSKFARFIPAFLVMAALSIDLAAGRWGAYIRSPIPGLYLADLLLVVGAMGAVFQLKLLAQLPRRVVAVFLLPASYLLILGVDSLLLRPAPDRYLAVRDLAPYAYLSLVPFIAIALVSVSFPVVVWVIRISTLVHAAGFLLTLFGVVVPFHSAGLGSDTVSVFEYRGDLLGVIFGIGLVAWGRWPGALSAVRLAQFAFVVLGLASSSRSALVTFVVFLVAAYWRERTWLPLFRVIACLVAAFLAATGLASVAVNLATPDYPAPVAVISATPDDPAPVAVNLATPDYPAPVAVISATPDDPAPVAVISATPGDPAPVAVNRATPDDPAIPEPDATAWQLPALQKTFATGSSTTRARLITYDWVIESLLHDGLWQVGAGPGTDVLYRICANRPLEERAWRDDGTGRELIAKCPVDDDRAASPLRDPHQWFLNSMIYFGIVGTAIFVFAIVFPAWRLRRTRFASLPLVAIAGYFLCGSFGVIISAPFGMLPVAVMLGWLLALSRTSSGAAQAAT